MPMTPGWRKFGLITHVVCSVGWFGSVAAFVALAIIGVIRQQDAHIVRALYPSMELIAWYVIVPFSVAALVTGLVQSMGTEWGLFRHCWVLAKFALTVGATGLLLLHMGAVRHAAVLATQSPFGPEFSGLQTRLIVDAGFAAVVLIVITTLSIYKPGGLTPYGWRKQQELAQQADRALRPDRRSWPRAPWPYIVPVIGVLLLVVILHLTGVVGHH